MPSVLETLTRRGFIDQVTDPQLGELLDREAFTAYAGFDPSSLSLHIGNLVPAFALVHLQRAGHTPLVVLGGATGMIGDPSGKSKERNLLTVEHVRANCESIGRQLSRCVRLEGENAGRMLNNADWTEKWTYLDWLRDIGKHFSVNVMLSKDSVKRRLEQLEAGLSYTEFSYMLLQAYDFLHLFDEYGCRLQVGGSDQWGNITAGIELIRRLRHQPAYGITLPLVTTAGGQKFGKTEVGAVWLDADRTSVWDFYQYWVRTDDRDVVRYLKLFTFLPLEQIEELEAKLRTRPEERAAHQALAREVTRLVHGEEQMVAVERGARTLYSQELRDLSDDELCSLFADAPTVTVTRARLAGGIPVVDLLVESGLVPSRSEARRRLGGGGIYVNNMPVEATYVVNEGSLASPSCVVLRSGKKNYCLVRVN